MSADGRGAPRLGYEYRVGIVFLLGLFMELLDMTVVNIAIPTLQAEFDAELAGMEWVVTGYLLSLAVFIPVAGFLADRFGRDTVIVASLLLSPPCGLLMLHGPGALLWIGAALVGLTLTGSMVALTVRGQELMPRSVAMVSGLMLGFSVGMGGLAVAPMAALAEQIGLSAVADICALLPLPAALIALTLRQRRPLIAAA
jgi:MFS family permease